MNRNILHGFILSLLLIISGDEATRHFLTLLPPNLSRRIIIENSLRIFNLKE